ncbi:MAG: hypothetical protein ACQEQV_05495 [Fibrobacterota bacterium]
MNAEQILQRPVPWLAHADEPILLSRRIRLKRNCAKYPFPPTASLLEKEAVFRDISAAVEKCSPGVDHDTIQLASLGDMGKTLLFERDIIPMDMARSEGARGVILTEGRPAALINGSDHLELYLDCDSNMEDAWEEVNRMDTCIGDELTYAFNETRGFLLSNTREAGTGLQAEFTLHLPGLILTETLHESLSGLTQLGCSAEGKFKRQTDSWGALFTVRAGAYAGDTEREIISRGQSLIARLCEKEEEARVILQREAPLALEDKIYRSVGILSAARTLSIPQMLNLTSNIRLGIDLGIFRQKDAYWLNGVMTDLMQSSIALTQNDDTPTSEGMDRHRADRCRRIMAEISCA